MQYTEGTIGRVFQVRVDHGEDLLVVLERFVREKGVRWGYIHFIGALQEGRVVTGPREMVLPPDPAFESYRGGWEVLGFGSITPGEGGPRIHYHAALGRGREALAGCLREAALTYIIVEAVVVELVGGTVSRRMDGVTGMELPSFG